MNQRIHDLLTSAEEQADGVYNRTMAKFAELMIRDFITILEDERKAYAQTTLYESAEYYARMEAKQAAIDYVIDSVKYQYGVDR